MAILEHRLRDSRRTPISARMRVVLWAAPGSPQLVTALDQHDPEPGLEVFSRLAIMIRYSSSKTSDGSAI
jgi:hypothetical protein